MSYFSKRRKASYEAERAAIEARKGVSPFAEYDGGKYEMQQYEEEPTGYWRSQEQTETANISVPQRGRATSP